MLGIRIQVEATGGKWSTPVAVRATCARGNVNSDQELIGVQSEYAFPVRVSW